MPLVHDAEHRLFASARPPPRGARSTPAMAADPELIDRDGAPVQAQLAARAQGAAGRLGQLLRLPHQPARVAGTARRARAARTHRRDGRPRRRAGAHVQVDRRRAPTHPSLIDTTHVTDELFGFVNIPMAVWIDEDRHHRAAGRERLGRAQPAARHGDARRPARAARPDAPRGEEDPRRRRGLPRRDRRLGAARRGLSRFALSPDEVVARSQPRGDDEARAAACFELGEHLLPHRSATTPRCRGGAKRTACSPTNWTYKRQAWTLSPRRRAPRERPDARTERRLRGQLARRCAAPGGGEALHGRAPALSRAVERGVRRRRRVG